MTHNVRYLDRVGSGRACIKNATYFTIAQEQSNKVGKYEVSVFELLHFSCDGAVFFDCDITKNGTWCQM